MATREEKLDMFAMRLDGATLQEIGDKYGITRERVRQIVASGATGRPRKPFVCRWPSIMAWMERNDCTIEGLASRIEVSTTALRGNLSGVHEISKTTIDSILEVMGMTYEEAFKEEGNEKQ